MKKLLLSALALLGFAFMANAEDYPTGTKDAPISVKDFLNQGCPEEGGIANTWVKGYIVAAATGKTVDAGPEWEAPFTSNTNILIAQSSSEEDVTRCIPVQLTSGNIRNGLNLVNHPENLGHAVIICASREKYFGVPGLKSPTSYEWVGTAPEITLPEGVAYEGLTSSNHDGWTIQDGTLPELLPYVWIWDESYNCMTATAYKKIGEEQYRFPTDAKLISPVIDLAGITDAQLTVSNKINYTTNVAEYCKIYVQEVGGTPVHINLDKWPAGNSWTEVKGTASLKAFDGKKIQIIFNYTSTDSEACTWELYNVKVASATSGGDTPDDSKYPKGSLESPLTVDAFLANGAPAKDSGIPDTYVTCYIVGSTSGTNLKSGLEWKAPFTLNSNILVAQKAGETDVTKCIPVQLPSGDIRAALNLKDNPENLGRGVILCGSRETYMSAPGLKSVTSYKWTTDAPDPVTPPVEGEVVYSGLTSNADDWTINDGTLPAGLSFVWQWSDKYTCLKGSGYYQQAYATNATATSPVIDLTGKTNMELTATNQVGYANGKVADYCKTYIQVVGGEKVAVAFDQMPDGTNINTKVEGKISLKEFEGKKIQVIFNYISTAETACTWEISNLKVATVGATGGDTPDVPSYPTGSEAEPLTVNNFIADGAPAKDHGIPNTYVAGYIVGSIDTSDSSAYVNQFSAPFTSQTNILIAQNADETDVKKCIPVQLPAGDIRTALNLNENPGNLGKVVVLCGTRETYFSAPGLKSVKSYTLDGEIPDTPDNPSDDTKAIYSGLTSNADDWTINDGTLPEGLSYVWSWSDQYNCLKGSAYYKQAYAANATATSPVIDLTDYKDCELTAVNQVGYAEGKVAEFCKTYIQVVGGEKVAVAFDQMPDGTKVSTKVDGKISLKEFDGKKIQVIFNYISTAEAACTWEISNLKVTGVSVSGVEEIALEEEGEATYYTLQGVKVANPEKGIYVKVVNGKSSKVYVK